MIFLSKLLADLAVPILNWIYGKVSAWLDKALRIQRQYKEVREKNRKVKDQTLSAETKEERDAAAQNNINNF